MSLMSRLLGTRWLVRSPILLYRIGLGRLIGDGMLQLEHIGRKSGEPKRVVLEVAHRESEDVLILASGFGEKSQWYKNLKANKSCRVWIGNRRGVPATAEFLNVEESNDILAEYKITHPAMWQRLRAAIKEITGEEPTYIPMIRLTLS